LLSYLQIMQTLLLILRLSIVNSSWRFSMSVDSDFKYSIFDPERLGDEEKTKDYEEAGLRTLGIVESN
jgi:hypothetical protein